MNVYLFYPVYGVDSLIQSGYALSFLKSKDWGKEVLLMGIYESLYLLILYTMLVVSIIDIKK